MASLEHEEFIGALENIDYEACQSCLNTQARASIPSCGNFRCGEVGCSPHLIVMQVARDDFSFPELLQTLPKKELPRLCAGMRNQVDSKSL